VDHEVGTLHRVVAPQHRLQHRRADGGVDDHGQAELVRRAADRGHVEHVAVRVARRLDEDVDPAAALEPRTVAGADAFERTAEVLDREAVEPLDCDVEVALLAVPVVQQLVGAAVDVAAREHDVLVAHEVREDGVDRRHAGVEVPGQVFARERAGLEVHDVVGEADRRGVEQPRVDLEQRLAALERVLHPLGAGVEVGGRAGDDRRGAEQRGDVVEYRVGALGGGLRRFVQQRLVRLAQRVLQRVEDLRELEAQEALRVEPCDAVALVERGQLAHRNLPELMRRGVARVEVAREFAEAAAELGLRVDREMPQLLFDEARNARCASGVATGAQFAREREVRGVLFHPPMVAGPRARVQSPFGPSWQS
jgi:hypothetical protein